MEICTHQNMYIYLKMKSPRTTLSLQQIKRSFTLGVISISSLFPSRFANSNFTRFLHSCTHTNKFMHEWSTLHSLSLNRSTLSLQLIRNICCLRGDYTFISLFQLFSFFRLQFTPLTRPPRPKRLERRQTLQTIALKQENI